MDIRAVVAIDFGTTFSGFAYSNRADPEIITNDVWPQQIGVMKTNTVLQYDSNYQNVIKWGNPALAQKQSKHARKNKDLPSSKTVELFKLHLGNIPQNEKPPLPYQLNYEKAISDYLRELGKLIKETISTRWYGISFFEHVLLVISIPAEFDDRAKDTMRKCLHNAGLTDYKESNKVEFTTEPEAAAIYCMRNLKGQNEMIPINASFMVVDCGGGTVDLTTRRLLRDNKLSEITERTGDFCGGSYVDREFLKFLSRKLGESTMNLLRENNYGQMQYMIQQFCQKLKFHFTGNQNEFDPYEFDIEEICPVLIQYCNDNIKEEMEENDWVIDINFEDIKSMFDPVVGKIIRLIRGQLDSSKDKCSAIFLVGGFSESKYLQMRVKEEFGKLVPSIIVPKQPIAAIVRGACDYGIDMSTIVDRTLKYTYGFETNRNWVDGDPIDRKINYKGNDETKIKIFHCFVTRGTKVEVDEEFSIVRIPILPDQTAISFQIYKTTELSAEFCDEPGMKSLGTLEIELPDVHLGLDRNIEFSLIFGKMELVAKAKNLQNGRIYDTSFELDFKN
ncbi:actin-like ATPase domain-containing protein [Rhizophagus irregularis]|uniref:Actin-like ATPase domain-containing protein n=1 Tax=Rhizophagus irregularis TaxID=588596 RepID=A0A2N0PTN6_9GLOM|nr:actin-like ATPase domain-containing protein [Rhizophagus irregularis]